MVLGSVLVSSAFLSLVLAAPQTSIGHFSCASSCRRVYSPIYKLDEGKSYSYEFDTSSSTAVEGNLRDQTTLRLTGKAHIVGLSPCEYQLSLRDVAMLGTGMPHLQKVQHIQELEQKDVLFSYEGGIVNHVCPMGDDTAWSVNIKRAVLSMIQGSPRQTGSGVETETDIHGNCPTSFKTTADASSLVKVKKFKDLTRCSERNGIHSVLTPSHYFTPSALQSIPLLRSSSNCEQVVNGDGIVQDVSCTENYSLRPYIAADSYAHTTVTASLKFKDSRLGTPRNLVRRANRILSTLKFDHSEETHTNVVSEGKIKTLIGHICQKSGDSVLKDVPSLFSNLVYEMRMADYKTLTTVYGGLNYNGLCRQPEKLKTIYLDALPLVGTAASVKTMVDILQEQEDTGVHLVHEKEWYTSLAFTKYPCTAAIEATYPLVEKEHPSTEALLGVSGLVRRFCRQDSECYKKSGVVQLVRKIANHLGYKCRTNSPKHEAQVISSLKALGNIGYLPSDVQTMVKDCIENEDNLLSVRLSAIDTSRFDPCSGELKSVLLQRLLDINEDPEIRIASYLGLVRCPCPLVLRAIQIIMDEEQSMQVGSFITSHLWNLQKSSSPLKRELQAFIRNIHTNKKFPSDPRKFSRNFEWSYYDADYNTGMDVDSNLIFSPSSYLPRSAMLNLTVNLFGTSVNLFEIGGRVEGLEHMVESLFGPKGYYHENSFRDFLQDTQEKMSSVGEKIKTRFGETLHRRKRSLDKYELASLTEEATLKDEFYKTLRGHTYFRMFGTELSWSTVTGRNTDLSFDGIIEKIFSTLDSTIDQAADIKMDVVRSFVFLDSSISYPTIMGVPLKLGINGTTSLSINIENQLDLRKILQDPRNFRVKSKIIPSSATEISCTMAMDSHLIRSGVKTITTLHTSTAMDLSLEITRGKMVELDIGLPQEKIEIIDVKSSLYKVQQKYPESEEKIELKPVNTEVYSIDHCIDQASEVLGIKLCAKGKRSRSTPNPFLLFNSPLFLTVTMEKTEPSMTGYHFKTELQDEHPNKKQFDLIFSTPGSITNRLVSLKFDLLTESNTDVRVKMLSPWISYTVEGFLVNTDVLKKMQVKFGQGDSLAYSILGQMKIQTRGKRHIYSPLIEISTPGSPSYKVIDGRMIYFKGKKADLNLEFLQKEYTLTGNVEADKTKGRNYLNVGIKKLQMVSPQGKVAIDGDFTKDDNTYTTNFKVQYGKLSHEVKFDAKLQDLSAGQLYHFKTTCDLQYSKYPEYNFNFKYEFQKTAKLVENELALTHGPTLDSRNQLSLLQITKYDLDSYRDLFYDTGVLEMRDLFISNDWKLSYPKWNIYISIDHNLSATPKDFANELEIKYAPEKKVVSNFYYTKKEDPSYGYDVKGEISYPGQKITFTETLKEVSEGRHEFSSVVRSEPGGQCQLAGFRHFLQAMDGFKDEFSAQFQCSMHSHPFSFYTLHYRQGVNTEKSVTIEAEGEKKFVANYSFDRQDYDEYNVAVKCFAKGYLDSEAKSTVRPFESIKSEINVILPSLDRRLNGQSEWKAGDMHTSSDVLYWGDSTEMKKIYDVQMNTKFGFSDIYSFVEWQLVSRILDQETTINVNAKETLKARDIGGETMDSSSVLSINFPSGKQFILKESVVLNADEYGYLDFTLKREIILPGGMELSHSGFLRLPDYIHGFDFESQFSSMIVHPQGETLQCTLELSHLTTSSKRSIAGKFNLLDSESSAPFDFDFKFDTEIGAYQLMTKSQWSPLDSLSLEMSGSLKDDVSLGETVLKDLLEFKTTGVYEYIFKYKVMHMYDSYKVSHTTNLQWDENSGLDFVVSTEPTDWLYRLEIYSPGTARRVVDMRGNAADKITNVFKIMKGDKEKFKLDFEMQHKIELDAGQRNRDVLFRIRMDTSAKYYRKAELRLDYTAQYDRRSTARVDATLKLLTGETERSVHFLHHRYGGKSEVTVTLSHPDNTVKINGHWETQPGGSYNMAGRLEWGMEGHYISGTGKLNVNPVELHLSVDSLLETPRHWELLAHYRVTGQRRRIELLLKEGTKERLKFSLNFTKEKKNGSVSYRGVMELKEDESSGEIAFAYKDNRINYRNEVGHEKVISLQTRGDDDITVELRFKDTDRHTRQYISVCVQGSCQQGELSLRDKSTDPEAQGYEAKIILKRTDETEGTEETRGLIGILIDEPGNVEQKLQLLIHKEKDVIIGYKLYHYPGDFGVEVYIPKRTIALQAEFPEKTFPVSTTLFTFWLDKNNEPDKKSILKYVSQEYTESDGTKHTAEILFRNPDMHREMSAKYEVHYGGHGETLFSTHLYLDVFAKRYNRIIAKTKLNHMSTERGGFNFTLHSEVKSKTLDAEMYSHIGLEEGLFTTGLTSKYDTEEGSREWYNILVGSTDNFYLIAKGPTHDILVTSRWKLYQYSGNEVISIHTTALLPGVPRGAVVVQVTTSPMIDMKLYEEATPHNYYYVAGGMRNDRTLEVVAQDHTTGLQMQEDFCLLAYLNTTRLLYNRLSWDTDGNSAALDSMYRNMENFATETQAIFENTAIMVVSDFIANIEKTASLLPTWETVGRHYKQEVAEIQEEFQEFSSAWTEVQQQLYKDVHRIDKLLGQAVVSLGSAIVDITEFIAENIIYYSKAAIERLSTASENIVELITYSFGMLGKALGHLGMLVVNIADVIASGIANLIEDIGCLIFHTCDEVYRKNLYFASAMDRFYKFTETTYFRFEKWIFTIPESFQTWMDDVSAWIESNKFLKKFFAQINYNWDEYEKSLQKMRESVEEYLHDGREQLKSFILDVTSGFKSPEIEKTVQDFLDYIDRIFENPKEMSWEDIQDLIWELYESVKEEARELVIFDIKNGLIEYHVPLPSDVHSLSDLTILITDYKPATFETDFTSDFSIWDHYYQNKPPSDPADWIPPFNAHAMLVGSRHYVSFDKNHYDFVGKCQYVLSQDFVDGNFSLVADYSNMADEGSKIFFSEGDHTIEIHSDYKVLLNNVPVDLPVQAGDIRVLRDWNRLIIDSKKGISLIYDVQHDISILHLNGFYFGKVMGIFGKYNYETRDEWMLPSGKVARNMEAFVNSWKVNRRCIDSPAELKSADIDTYGGKLCERWFVKSSSPLRSCFGVVDRQPWFKMCMKLMYPVQIRSEGQGEEVVCKVVAAYITACRAEEVNLIMPKECVQCKINEAVTLQKGDTEILGGRVLKSDTVFVVEQEECNRDGMEELIPGLFKNLQEDLRHKGYKDNAFALIGYSGPNQKEAEIYTALNELAFTGKTKNMEFETAGFSDTFGALKKATEYPFRAGAAKTIILMACTECNAKHMTVSYGEMQNELLAKGIYLHILANQPVALEGSKNKKGHAFVGYDSEGVYQRNSFQDGTLKNSKNLRKQIVVKTDLCTALVQEHHGAVFTTDNYFNYERTYDKKLFSQVMSQRIIRDLEPNPCHKCRCVVDQYIFTRGVCGPCSP